MYQCLHPRRCAFDAAAGAANGLKAQGAWVRETGTLTLHGEQTDLSLCPSPKTDKTTDGGGYAAVRAAAHDAT